MLNILSLLAAVVAGALTAPISAAAAEGLERLELLLRFRFSPAYL
jgi:hypothetical protein